MIEWTIGEDEYNKKYNWLYDMNLFDHLSIELQCLNFPNLTNSIEEWHKDQLQLPLEPDRLKSTYQ